MRSDYIIPIRYISADSVISNSHDTTYFSLKLQGSAILKRVKTVNFNSRISCRFKNKKLNRGKWYFLPCVLWKTRWTQLIYVDQLISTLSYPSGIQSCIILFSNVTLRLETNQLFKQDDRFTFGALWGNELNVTADHAPAADGSWAIKHLAISEWATTEQLDILSLSMQVTICSDEWSLQLCNQRKRRTVRSKVLDFSWITK